LRSKESGEAAPPDFSPDFVELEMKQLGFGCHARMLLSGIHHPCQWIPAKNMRE
jgi:hypothetical protein